MGGCFSRPEELAPRARHVHQAAQTSVTKEAAEGAGGDGPDEYISTPERGPEESQAVSSIATAANAANNSPSSVKPLSESSTSQIAQQNSTEAASAHWCTSSNAHAESGDAATEPRTQTGHAHQQTVDALVQQAAVQIPQGSEQVQLQQPNQRQKHVGPPPVAVAYPAQLDDPMLQPIQIPHTSARKPAKKTHHAGASSVVALLNKQDSFSSEGDEGAAAQTPVEAAQPAAANPPAPRMPSPFFAAAAPPAMSPFTTTAAPLEAQTSGQTGTSPGVGLPPSPFAAVAASSTVAATGGLVSPHNGAPTAAPGVPPNTIGTPAAGLLSSNISSMTASGSQAMLGPLAESHSITVALGLSGSQPLGSALFDAGSTVGPSIQASPGVSGILPAGTTAVAPTTTPQQPAEQQEDMLLKAAAHAAADRWRREFGAAAAGRTSPVNPQVVHASGGLPTTRSSGDVSEGASISVHRPAPITPLLQGNASVPRPLAATGGASGGAVVDERGTPHAGTSRSGTFPAPSDTATNTPTFLQMSNQPSGSIGGPSAGHSSTQLQGITSVTDMQLTSGAGASVSPGDSTIGGTGDRSSHEPSLAGSQQPQPQQQQPPPDSRTSASGGLSSSEADPGSSHFLRPGSGGDANNNPSPTRPSPQRHPHAGLVLHASTPEGGARPATLELHRVNKEIRGLQWLGQGAGGVVYKGLWNDVPVAIKFMLSSSPDQMNDKFREAVLARYVSHPNVVQTYTYDRAYLSEAIVKRARADLGLNRTLSNESLNKSLNIMSLDEFETTGIMGDMGVVGGSRTPSLGIMAAAAAAAAKASVGSSGSFNAGNPAQLGSHPHEGAAPASNRTGSGTSASGLRGSHGHEAQSFVYGEGDSALMTQGWSMVDVLVHLGAQQGQYLTHIIMELCDGGTLTKAIHKGLFCGSKDGSAGEYHKMRAMLRTAREIARGVAFLHSLNIVHGDLKPGNVLLKSSTEDRRGFVAKVADFGLARYDEGQIQGLEAATRRSDDEPQGTLYYLAPEVLNGAVATRSADIYAFGVLLWQMCTGSQPFAGLQAAQVMYGKQQGTLHLQWPSSVYSPLRKLGDLCMDQEPRNRPTAEQVVKALLKVEQHVHRRSGATSSSNNSSSTGAAPGGGAPKPAAGGLGATSVPGLGPGASPFGHPSNLPPGAVAIKSARGIGLVTALAQPLPQVLETVPSSGDDCTQ